MGKSLARSRAVTPLLTYLPWYSRIGSTTYFSSLLIISRLAQAMLQIKSSSNVCLQERGTLGQILTPIFTDKPLDVVRANEPAAFASCPSLGFRHCNLSYSNVSYECNGSPSTLNSDWRHCVGLHEVLTLSQISTQHPTRLQAVQRVVGMLNQLGVVVAITGPAGVGKSTIAALAAYYGMRMLDLEDVHPHDELGKEESRNAALTHALAAQRNGTGHRTAMLVGLSGVSRLGVYSQANTDLAIAVLLRPSRQTMNARWLERNTVLHDNRQATKHQAQISDTPRGYSVLHEVDAIVQSEGCAEQVLVDVGTAAILWLAQALEQAAQSCMINGYGALLWEGLPHSPAAWQRAVQHCHRARQRKARRLLLMSAHFNLDAGMLLHMAGRLQGRSLERRESTRFVAIAWGCAKPLWAQMVDFARSVLPAGEVSAGCALHIGNMTALTQLVRRLYAVDNVGATSLDKKLGYLSQCTPECFAMNISVPYPVFRIKDAKGTQISVAMEHLKRTVRGHFGPQIVNYTYDTSFHAGDNELIHTRHIDALLTEWGLPQSCGVAAEPEETRASSEQQREIKAFETPRPTPLPDIRRYLQAICSVPHAVFKMDGQPGDFPRAITSGGDVDILTSSSEHGTRLKTLTAAFFHDAQETYKVRIIDSSPHGAFQLRLHERNAPHALVYQIHLSWHWYTLTATTLEQVLQRRQPRAVPEGCLEVVSAEDDEMLRKVECAAEPSKKGRCLSAAATSPSISRMPSPSPPALRTAPWLEEALAGRVASRSIPRRIWTFWDSGADGAPTVVRHAITSWVVRNPTWRVTLLTDRDVLGYLEGFSAVEWAQVAGTQKGDTVRLAVLAQYGGVWVDATQFCATALDDWLPRAVGAGDFFAFQVGSNPPKNSDAYAGSCPGCEPPGEAMPDNRSCLPHGAAKSFGRVIPPDQRTGRGLMPSSSFLAAVEHSPSLKRWYDYHMRGPMHKSKLLSPVYRPVLFESFEHLVQHDPAFKEAWLKMAEISSRRTVGSLPTSGYYRGRDQLPALTPTVKARIDRGCAPTFKLTFKGIFNRSGAFPSGTVHAYLFNATESFVESALKPCGTFPCVWPGPAATFASTNIGNRTNGTLANRGGSIMWLRELELTQPTAPSCAIVGSGSALTGRGLGALIEAHDLVVRVNRVAELAEQHVGNRTDVLFSKLSRYDERRSLLTPSKDQGRKSAPCALIASRSPKCPFRAFVLRGGGAGFETRKLASLKNEARHSYLGLGFQQPDVYDAVRRMAGTNYSDATTGFHAVLTFRAICGRMSLFGFTGNTTFDGHAITNHMLDREHMLLHEMQSAPQEGFARVEVVV